MLDLLKSVLGGGTDFYPFEALILGKVKSHLPAESSRRLQLQLAVINKIQRLSDGKEVNLYQMRHGKPAFDDSLRFPAGTDEELLASVNLTGPNRLQLKAEVWLAKGRIFSLVFNKPPKQFFAVKNLRTVQSEITDVKIWFDPMRPRSVGLNMPIDPSRLTGWLREWFAKGQISGLHTPLPQSDRAELLARIDAQLPSDYIEVIDQTEGARLDSCAICGVAGIREIVLPEAIYYVIAEIEGLGVLAVKAADRDAELYLLNYENSDVRPMGSSIQNAVTELLR